MNRLSQKTMRRLGFAGSREGRAPRGKFAFSRSGSRIEVLENRTLLSLDLNNVENLKALAITAVQNVAITKDVATFNDTDPTAIASDFTAAINCGDGSNPTAGTITEDASNLFHVAGTHVYAQSGSFPALCRHDQGRHKRHVVRHKQFQSDQPRFECRGHGGRDRPQPHQSVGNILELDQSHLGLRRALAFRRSTIPTAARSSRRSLSRSRQSARRPARRARSSIPTPRRPTSPSRDRAVRSARSSSSPHSTARSPAGARRPTAAQHRR